MDHLVDIEESDQQALKDMQTTQHTLKAVVKTALDGIATEYQPFRQDFQQVFHRRTVVEADHIEVNAIALLKIGGGEQVMHDLIEIHAI